MLLTLALLVAQTPQPPVVVPLQGTPPDDDGPHRLYFTSDSRSIVVQHDLEGGTCSVTRLDVALGEAAARSLDFEETHSIAVSPDGRLAIVPEEYSYRVRVLALPSLQLLGTIPVTAGGNAHLFATIDSTGTRAVMQLEYGNRLWVVNLAQLVQERVIVLPSSRDTNGIPLAADDVSVPFVDPQSVFTLDISTGLESARAAYTVPGTGAALALSGDGTTCVVIVRDPIATTTYHLERFAVPGLTSLGTATINVPFQFEWSSVPSPQLDAAGDTLLLSTAAGPLVVDTATGIARTMPGSGYLSVLTPNGDRVVAADGGGIVVADSSTGATLAAFPARGDDLGLRYLCLSPNGRFAAVSRNGNDRVEVFDLAGPVPTRVRDISSGFGVEADGPFQIGFDAAGTSVAVVGRDSDDLRRVALEGPPTITGRITLDREPLDIALRADGRALVVHGRGASLSVVDLDGPTELARYLLPESARTVQPEPTGTRAWVALEGPTSRSLALVDTASGAVLQVIVLPGGAGVSAFGRELVGSVLFDLPRGRAFVASPDTAELALVDLALGAVVATVPVPTTMQNAALALRADGSVVFHHAAGAEVTAFDVTATALSPRWSWACPGPASPSLMLRAQIHLVDSDRSLVVTSERVSCTGAWTMLDPATGQPQGALGFSGDGTWLEVFGEEVWVNGYQFSQGFDRYRVSNGTATFVSTEVAYSTCCDRPFTHPFSQKAVAMTDTGVWNDPLDRLLVLDLVQDTAACAPSAPNATGVGATLRVDGRGSAGAPHVFVVEGLQPNAMPGYLLLGSANVPPFPLPFGVGSLCLGGTLGRFVQQVQTADAAGRQRFYVDTTALPTALGPVAVQAGTSWSFQTWYRDTDPTGGARSNTSTARVVRFD
jgi:hypothetical protein